MKQKLQVLLADFLECRGVFGVFKRKKVFKPEKQTVEDVPVTYYEYCREELARETDFYNNLQVKKSVVRASLIFVDDESVMNMAKEMVERRRSEIARNLKMVLVNYCKGILDDIDSEEWKKDSIKVFLKHVYYEIEPEEIFQWSVWICTLLKIVNFENIGVYDYIETKTGEGFGSQKLSAAELNKPVEQREEKKDDE